MISSMIAELLSLIDGESSNWKSGIRSRNRRMISKTPNKPMAMTNNDCKKTSKLDDILIEIFHTDPAF
ncbi:hypothetical protein IMAU20067_01078 [Lactobacillus helveticus]|nr:hypothetical protein [Lactobacillus helveticus]